MMTGGHLKNLFLRDRKGGLFLVVLREDRQVPIKSLRRVLGARGGLSFATAERLLEVLGVEPGAVTPFAVLNDAERRVTLALDDWLRDVDVVHCHPLHNRATTAIGVPDLLRFFAHTGHEPVWVDAGGLEAQG